MKWLVAVLASVPLVMGAAPGWVVSGSVDDLASTGDAVWALKHGTTGFGDARFGRYEPGVGWTTYRPPEMASNTMITQLAMTSPDNGWAMGGYPDAYLARWDGSTWQRQRPVGELRATDQIFDISAVSADDMWLIGYRDRYRIWHWDGATFAQLPVPFASPGFPADVVALSAHDVWVVGFTAGVQPAAAHWDGSTWTVVALSSLDQWPSMVVASSSSNVWAMPASVQAGDDLASVHWNGARWRPVDVPRDDLLVKDIAASPGGGAWMVASGARDWQSMIFRTGGSTWSRMPVPRVCGGDSHAVLQSVDVAGADVYVGGRCRHHSGDRPSYTLVLHYDGDRWTRI